jgi:hypothetical protein
MGEKTWPSIDHSILSAFSYPCIQIGNLLGYAVGGGGGDRRPTTDTWLVRTVQRWCFLARTQVRILHTLPAVRQTGGVRIGVNGLHMWDQRSAKRDGLMRSFFPQLRPWINNNYLS